MGRLPGFEESATATLPLRRRPVRDVIPSPPARNGPRTAPLFIASLLAPASQLNSQLRAPEPHTACGSEGTLI